MGLREIILQDKRQYFIDKVKKPLMKALIVLANRYPEPTLENTTHPNDHVWIQVWDKFLKMEDNPQREPLFRAIRKVMICESSHDPYYRDRIQVLLELWLEEVLKGNWKPRSLDHPADCWRVDPNKRGKGYDFLVDRFYHKEKHDSD